MTTTKIYPRNVKQGDRMLTTNGMREVLSVTRHPGLTEIAIEDVAVLTGRTTLRLFDYRRVKLTVERAQKAGV